MKNLMLTTAMLAATAFGAAAQGTVFRTAPDPTQLRASDFIGMRVYASDAAVAGDAADGKQAGWNDIGEINDVVLSRDGKVDSVLVDIGGFLGIGERHVAVDMSAIRFVGDSKTADDPNDFFLVMTGTKAMLEQAPEYTWSKTAAAATTAAATDAAAAGTAAATDTAATAADTTAAARAPVTRDGFSAATPEVLTADKLTGAKVYDSDDKWIGEVSQLILSDDGQVKEAVVDVGGFLGIGEKPVALALNDIDILRQDNGSEVRVYVPMTKDQLEQMPTYKKS